MNLLKHRPVQAPDPLSPPPPSAGPELGQGGPPAQQPVIAQKPAPRPVRSKRQRTTERR